jgi:hypothetical protein
VGPRQARGRKSLILKIKRRFAIRATKFGPETDAIFEVGGKRFHGANEKRGSFEGAKRIPLRALMFLFNDLAFLRIPRKSLKFHSSLFSIPTGPSNPNKIGLSACRLAPSFSTGTIFSVGPAGRWKNQSTKLIAYAAKS